MTVEGDRLPAVTGSVNKFGDVDLSFTQNSLTLRQIIKLPFAIALTVRVLAQQVLPNPPDFSLVIPDDGSVSVSALD